jgi:hypothetical protein
MIIGQSAGVAAVMALRNGKQVRAHERLRLLMLPVLVLATWLTLARALLFCRPCRT